MKMSTSAACAALLLAGHASAGEPFELTHNLDDRTIQYGTIAGISDTPPVTTHDNTWWRFFGRDQFGLEQEARLTGVRFGIEQAAHDSGWQPITVTLFAAEVVAGELEMTQIGQVTDFVANQERKLVTFPVDVTLEADRDLVVAVAPADFGSLGYTGSTFFIGTNRLGETGVSMISCPSAGDAEPTPYYQVSDDAKGLAIVMTVLGETGCAGDCDGSGQLDFFDFVCFMSAFTSADPRADCDGNGALDLFDVVCFQELIARPCD